MQEFVNHVANVIIKQQQSKIYPILHAVNVIIMQHRKEILKYLYRLSMN